MKQVSEMASKEIAEAYLDHTPSVYLIGNKKYNFLKIGKSDKPWMRLSALNSPQLPFPIEMLALIKVGNSDSWIENQLHKAFSKKRLRGEWFHSITAKQFTRKTKELQKRFEKEYPR